MQKAPKSVNQGFEGTQKQIFEKKKNPINYVD